MPHKSQDIRINRLAVSLIAGLALFTGCVPVVSVAPPELPLPIFVRPAADKDNSILAVYIQPRDYEVEITVVFSDEDHPNPFADYVYDQYRLPRWNRVKDIETFVYRYKFAANRSYAQPRSVYFFSTHSGHSVYHQATHRTADVPWTKFHISQGRPIIYINTWNHMFAEFDTNPQRPKQRIDSYPLRRGSRHTAERDFQRSSK